jgi:hypothetical protein
MTKREAASKSLPTLMACGTRQLYWPSTNVLVTRGTGLRFRRAECYLDGFARRAGSTKTNSSRSRSPSHFVVVAKSQPFGAPPPRLLAARPSQGRFCDVSACRYPRVLANGIPKQPVLFAAPLVSSFRFAWSSPHSHLWRSYRHNSGTNCVPAATEIGDKYWEWRARLLLCCGDNLRQ